MIYLFLFLLPWQTRLILRPGILNGGSWEYGIAGIYGTELILWLLVLVHIGRQKFDKVSLRKKLSPFLCLVFFLSLFIYFAVDRLVAIQQFIHIFEAVIIFILLIKLPIDRFKAAYAFLAGLALQAALGIYQFLTQSIFVSKWLGMTLHNAAVGGTSVLENSAGRWLRAYAGFPHPNIFGGYMAAGSLLVAILLTLFTVDKKTKVFLLVANALMLAGLFFSFSRSAWLGLAIGLMIYWIISRKHFLSAGNFKLFLVSIILLSVINSLLFFPLLKGRLTGVGRLEAQAIEERAGGYGEAWQVFKRYPFFGVGLGNYTLAAHNEVDALRPAWGYQPIHNVFLLILAESGVAGIFIILFFCYFIGARFHRKILPLLSLFFILAIFDHYLWTLYVGSALVGVGVGMLTLLRKNEKVIATNEGDEYVAHDRKVSRRKDTRRRQHSNHCSQSGWQAGAFAHSPRPRRHNEKLGMSRQFH
ncbi:MAG: O-antigen ligase family protein [Patescibacteria group bacterium]